MALEFAAKESKSGVRFTPGYLERMYQIVITTIDDKTMDYPFEFKISLKFDILLYIFACSYQYFDEMEERFLQERDIRHNLEKNLRPVLQEYFENIPKKKKQELAACLFTDVVKKQIESALESTMGPFVAKELSKKGKFQNKGQFHARILIELGEKGNFESYIPYLEDPVEFVRTKLVESIDKYCLNENLPFVNTLFKSQINKIRENIMVAFQSAKRKTNTENAKLDSAIC